ncbi:hypothetical protein IWX90DRAFT_292001 [Phyllosticta citrichinensis]|uniref:Uncharacterized protein n=1 Tax=Phyllosticta citrichinensis TaxID=1130410 RepID=A0ABR1XK24_9PEZI
MTFLGLSFICPSPSFFFFYTHHESTRKEREKRVKGPTKFSLPSLMHQTLHPLLSLSDIPAALVSTAHTKPKTPKAPTLNPPNALAIIAASLLCSLLPRQVLRETTNRPATDHVLQHDPARMRVTHPPSVAVLLVRHQRRRPRVQSALRDMPSVRPRCCRQRCPHDANHDQHRRN